MQNLQIRNYTDNSQYNNVQGFDIENLEKIVIVVKHNNNNGVWLYTDNEGYTYYTLNKNSSEEELEMEAIVDCLKNLDRRPDFKEFEIGINDTYIFQILCGLVKPLIKKHKDFIFEVSNIKSHLKKCGIAAFFKMNNIDDVLFKKAEEMALNKLNYEVTYEFNKEEKGSSFFIYGIKEVGCYTPYLFDGYSKGPILLGEEFYNTNIELHSESDAELVGIMKIISNLITENNIFSVQGSSVNPNKTLYYTQDRVVELINKGNPDTFIEKTFINFLKSIRFNELNLIFNKVNKSLFIKCTNRVKTLNNFSTNTLNSLTNTLSQTTKLIFDKYVDNDNSIEFTVAVATDGKSTSWVALSVNGNMLSGVIGVNNTEYAEMVGIYKTLSYIFKKDITKVVNIFVNYHNPMIVKILTGKQAPVRNYHKGFKNGIESFKHDTTIVFNKTERNSVLLEKAKSLALKKLGK